MARKEEVGAAVDVLDRPGAELVETGGNQTTMSKLVIPLGRGSRGKTVFARWVAERALNGGREVVIADADRTNRTLAAYFRTVVSPPTTLDRGMRDWMDGLLEAQIEARKSVVLDLGGGDQILKRAAEEMPLVPMLEECGISPVAVHMIGPDVDDLAYLQDVEADGTFAPEHTMLVFNEGVLPEGLDFETGFRAVMQHQISRAAMKRGAKVIRMPPLRCMREVDRRRQLFVPAMEGKASSDDQPAIGPFNRQRISFWWKQMEEAFKEVSAWLP